MRRSGTLVRWLITAALLLVQVHICQATYILPTGKTCLICPSIVEVDSHAQAEFTAKDQHGDCHDCCRLRPCDDSGKAKAKVAAPILGLTFALPGVWHFTVSIPELEERVTTFYIEGCPPTGPPSDCKSRAPPIQLN